MAAAPPRFSTGIDALDKALGGGLLPGTLTVVIGATGIGKTQLGVQFAGAGMTREGRRGVIFDMQSRGDAQSHADYARRIADWSLREADPGRILSPAEIFDAGNVPEDYLRVFEYQGQRVTKRDLDEEGWRAWQAELARKLAVTIAFFYRAFTGGIRRVVIDGVEPVDRPSDSVQLELFEYVYHQILRKEHDWVARDLLRENYRAHAEAVHARPYDAKDISCVMLLTTRETMLEALIERPLDEGDALSNANTVICMGKTREGTKMGRALYIAKHRGSACSEQILPFTIDDAGVWLAT